MNEMERGIRDLLDLYEKSLAENKRLQSALAPFCAMAGEMFARNFEASDVVLALDNPDHQNRITFQDFLDARLAAWGDAPMPMTRATPEERRDETGK